MLFPVNFVLFSLAIFGPQVIVNAHKLLMGCGKKFTLISHRSGKAPVPNPV
jgi:hypothetical protein